ncbi:MAG: hypothetical protein ACTHJ4_05025 [Candidatus Nucleicultricaceae bacterium]
MKKYLPLLMMFGATLSADASRTKPLQDIEDVLSGLGPVFYYDYKLPRTESERQELKRYFDETIGTCSSPHPSHTMVTRKKKRNSNLPTDDATSDHNQPNAPTPGAILHLLEMNNFKQAQMQSKDAYLRAPSAELYLLHLMSHMRVYESDPFTTLLPYTSALFEHLSPKHHKISLHAVHKCHPDRRQELVATWTELGLIGDQLTRTILLHVFGRYPRAESFRMMDVIAQFKVPHFIGREIAKSLTRLKEENWEQLLGVMTPFIAKETPHLTKNLLQVFVNTKQARWESLKNDLLPIEQFLESDDLVNFAKQYSTMDSSKRQQINKLVTTLIVASNNPRLPHSDFLAPLSFLDIKDIESMEKSLRSGQLEVEEFLREFKQKSVSAS